MNQPKEGVYIDKYGKLKVFYIDNETTTNMKWVVDSGKLAETIFPGIKVNVVQEMSVGFPVFESFGALYKCEYLGEL